MHYFFRNVNDAFAGVVDQLAVSDKNNKATLSVPVSRHPSRYGEVLQITEPVTLTYSHPWERVLFSRKRDCNPFFHLFEALWMLAGRRDVEFLAYFNPRMREFSDNSKTLWGAYGYRWRRASSLYPLEDQDQIENTINELKVDPYSRRCVIAHWRDVDWCAIHAHSKDIPCNTHIYFQILDGKLEMTVCNRSNDMIWGALGANYVHFTFLQEYIALALNVAMGRYHHFSTNMHVYIDNWKPDLWLSDQSADGGLQYPSSAFSTPLVLYSNRASFDTKLPDLLDWATEHVNHQATYHWDVPFFDGVVHYAAKAFALYKQKRYDDALALCRLIHSFDWRVACHEWVLRRKLRAKTNFPELEVKDNDYV